MSGKIKYWAIFAAFILVCALAWSKYVSKIA